MKTKKLKIDKIRIDGGTQVRISLDPDTVAQYAELPAKSFPPCVVFFDGSDNWLAHGFHRMFAAQKRDEDSVECEVRKGSLHDAQWFALGANAKNGKPLTTADKHRAIELALSLKPSASARQIAELIGVSDHTVQKMKAPENKSGAHYAHLTDNDTPSNDGRCRGKDGKQYPKSSPHPSVSDDPPPPAEESPSSDDLPPDVDDEKEKPKSGRDRLGKPIANKRIQEAFDRDVELRQLIAKLNDVRRIVTEGCEKHDPLFYNLGRLQAFQTDLDNSKRQLMFCRPYTTCPYCHGKGCATCNDTGWVNKIQYANAPKDE